MAETKKKAPAKKTPVVEQESFAKKVDYKNAEKLLELKHVKQYFHFKNSDIKYLKAVHDVSFDVYKGEVFGLVGESGCGKTTTGRDILRLYPITSGDIYLEGVRIAAGTRWNEKEIKWTGIRAKAEIKELEAKKSDLNPESAEYKAIEKKIADIKAHVEKVRAEQLEKIKAAHEDNKHVNQNLVAHEIEVVEKKHKEGLLNEEQYKAALAEAKRTTLSHKVQMIFQDPIASLNPRMTVRNIIAEGLIINGIKDKEYIDNEVNRVLKLVGLVPEHGTRYPHEFSGGQRQRIGIARAIIMKPELIVADEPVSALDVSVQAQVINLLNDLRNTLGLTIIFIAHNLSVVKYFCDRIAVMYYGNVVELASSDELFAHPLHPYTKSLLSAVPFPDPIVEKNRTRIIYNPVTDHDYSEQQPTYREIVPGHFVRCNDEEEKKYLEELKK
ncbi:MAG: ATP-binding cassette domain-containing protein [Bacilli bacterium]|nr:ATP-binding cassette domain-containing protein [Bacilli bacterium]